MSRPNIAFYSSVSTSTSSLYVNRSINVKNANPKLEKVFIILSRLYSYGNNIIVIQICDLYILPRYIYDSGRTLLRRHSNNVLYPNTRGGERL